MYKIGSIIVINDNIWKIFSTMQFSLLNLALNIFYKQQVLD